MTVTLNIPDTPGLQQRERLAVALYDARLITQGQGAEMAGQTRREFFETLGRAGVSAIQYDSAEEIIAESEWLQTQEETDGTVERHYD